MDYHITKSDIDRMRERLRFGVPYTKDDPAPVSLDGEYDHHRDQATRARDWLEAIGLDPYDDNDYGEYKDGPTE